MKKFLLSIIVIFSLSIAIFVFYALLNVYRKFQYQERIAEAKYRLNKIYEHQKKFYNTYKTYDLNYISEERKEYISSTKKAMYRIGTVKDFPEIIKICPDCEIAKNQFKIVAFANFDSDPDLDIFTIDSQGKLNHVSYDL